MSCESVCGSQKTNGFAEGVVKKYIQSRIKEIQPISLNCLNRSLSTHT